MGESHSAWGKKPSGVGERAVVIGREDHPEREGVTLDEFLQILCIKVD